MYDRRHSQWIVNDDALTLSSFQSIVNCTEEGDIIFINTTQKISVERTVVLSKSLTISAYVNDTDLTDAVFPRAEHKISFACPRNESLFRVINGSITLANLALEDCDFGAHDQATALRVDQCQELDTGIILRLNHVVFKNISNSVGNGVMDMSDEACVMTELVDVQITNNTCGDIACLHLSGSCNLTDVTVSGSNMGSRNNKDGKSVIRLEAYYARLDITNTVATNNGLRVFYIKNIEHVSITESRFSNNSDMIVAGGGGVFRLDNVTTGVISNTEFDQNTAHAGACLTIRNSKRFTISHTAFLSNKANRGAAIHINNSPVVAQDLNIRNCDSTFRGAVFIENNCNVTFSNSIFERNSATNRGGAIFALDSWMSLEALSFGHNSAGMMGGALSSENSTLNVIRSNFTNNLSPRQPGGAVDVDRNSMTTLSKCYFIGNIATSGGAVRLARDSDISIKNCTFKGNQASKSGGALESDVSESTISGSYFVRNRAFTGGAISVRGKQTRISNSQFLNNFASEKCGALYSNINGSITFLNSTCKENKAAHGGCACVGHSSQLLSISSLFEENEALTKNGGAFMIEKEMNRNVTLQLVNCTVKSNKAQLGGALYVERDAAANNKCYNNEISCGGVALLGTELINNAAEWAGSAIYTNDEDAIRVACNWFSTILSMEIIPKEEFANLNVLTNERICSSWILKSSSARQGIPFLSFRARWADVKLNDTEQTGVQIIENKEVIKITNFKSGNTLPEIKVKIKDRFGTSPAFLPDLYLMGNFSSDDELFQGIIFLDLSSGQNILKNIRAYGVPKTYNLQLNYSDSTFPIVKVTVKVRHCVVGEFPSGDEVFCEACGDSFYRFIKGNSKNCQTCPTHANCSAKFIFPKNGFWNDHPCQTRIKKCLERSACSYIERFAKLQTLTREHQNCSYDTEVVSNYTNALCSKGYSGVLCGSCASGYGKSGPFSCGKCWSQFVSSCVLIASTVWLLGLAVVVIRSNMPLSEREIQRSRNFSTPPVEHIASTSRASFNVEMARMICEGVVSPVEPESRTPTPEEPEVELVDVEISKWKVGEMLKLMVNYAQTIAVAAYLNVDWTSSITNAFAVAETIGGFATHAIIRSIYCLVDRENQLHGPLFSMLVGIIQPLIVCLIIIIALSRIHRQLKSNLVLLFKKAAFVASIMAYISYLSITKLATRPFPCVDVHLYEKVDQSRQETFWATDTSLGCYSKEHLILLLLGVFVLLFFTVAFPVLTLMVLLYHRNGGTLRSSGVFDTLGFMYKAFNVEYVYWESFVLFRKAVLSVILVFSYRLGADIQTQLAAFVLVFSLYWQQRCCPYGNQFSELNGYESLSLFMTSVTFISGLFFHHQDTLEHFKILIACLLLVSNISFFLFLVFKFSQFLIQSFRVYVAYFDSPSRGRAPWYHVIKSYCSLKFHGIVDPN
eukprot:g5701.t1